MTPADFLSRVWPELGYYALATPFTPPGSSKTLYAHRLFSTVAEAAAFVDAQKDRLDIFYAPHALREPRVWNPSKEDPRTGELGAFEIRTQRNARASREFHLDLDVEAGNPKKYESQYLALVALKEFCLAVRLPQPMITSSGGGLHAYWLITEEIDSETWRGHATKLHRLVQHHGLLADPARTRDSASVLRVAGTFNFKNRAQPRPVLVLCAGVVTPTTALLQRFDDAVVRAGLTVRPPISFPADDGGLGSNTEAFYDGPPVAMKAVLAACAQMRNLALARGRMSEPEWYHGLNVVRFVERGDELAHKFSAGHPHYSRDETDRKLGQLAAKGVQPTSCAKLAEVCGEDACGGCAFAGRVKGPLVAARFKDPAPAPVAVTTVGSVTQTVTVPPPPAPYIRMKGGSIAVATKSQAGDEMHQILLTHDLYPLRRLVNAGSGLEQQVWRVVLPREGAKDFALDADALYDRRKFLLTIANQGIYPAAGNIPNLQDYMVAYIAELQRLADAEPQCNHLGWAEEQTCFILPDKILMPDGTVKPAQLSLGAQRSSAQVHKKGTLQRQVELLRFYDHPAYLANQFFILGAFAAPLFFATGHHGVILNASGEAGASKSTSLYAAASGWGSPEMYPINGTNSGATIKGRNERVATLANLPVCVDEITHIPIKEAVDLAMSITQPGHRIRLNESGVERASLGSYKATMMLATANNSLHGLLSSDNAAGTAGSMRVVEIVFRAARVHSKSEADDFIHALKENYGHLGEAFIAHVVQHREAVAARVRAVVREIDQAAGIQSSERFWSATVAAVLVAGEIANQLGLLSYDPALLRRWALEVQIPHMRGVVEAEYATPLGTLAEYLEHINGEILVTKGTNNVIRGPRGQLLAHYDQEAGICHVLKKAFKDYCQRSGANSLRIIEELHAPKLTAAGTVERVLASRHARKILGAHTDYAKAQSWCFSINMTHPEVAGIADSAGTATPPGKRPPLRLV